MTGKQTPVALLVALLAGCGLLGLPILVFGGDTAAYGCGEPVATPSAGGSWDRWSAVQVQHAAEIIAAGRQAKIPARGLVVALVTAMQESDLKVLANDNPSWPLTKEHSLALPHDGTGHNHDSVGLFQQRPLPPEGGGGWGTVAELMNPTTSARKFVAALQRVSGWEQMSIDLAAQAVQRSAYPDAYAKWEEAATKLIGHVIGAKNIGAGPEGSECGPVDGNAPVISAGGWTQPVHAAIVSGFRTPARPNHYGVDLGAPKFAAIRAAAAGKVIVAACNGPDGYSCDTDGSAEIPGCGWYVEIAHAGNVTTRYCHQVHQPNVKAGDLVVSGQIIGQVGSSGNSSGPHLHFEVHRGVAPGRTGTDADAVDPVDFMAANGAPLGK